MSSSYNGDEKVFAVKSGQQPWVPMLLLHRTLSGSPGKNEEKNTFTKQKQPARQSSDL